MAGDLAIEWSFFFLNLVFVCQKKRLSTFPAGVHMEADHPQFHKGEHRGQNGKNSEKLGQIWVCVKTYEFINVSG